MQSKSLLALNLVAVMMFATPSLAAPSFFVSVEMSDATFNFAGDGSPPDPLLFQSIRSPLFEQGTHFPGNNPLDSTSRFEYTLAGGETSLDLSSDIYFDWSDDPGSIAFPMLFLDVFVVVVTEPGEVLPPDFNVTGRLEARGVQTADNWPGGSEHRGSVTGEVETPTPADALLDISFVAEDFFRASSNDTILGQTADNWASGENPLFGGRFFNASRDIAGADDINGMSFSTGLSQNGFPGSPVGGLLDIDLSLQMNNVPESASGLILTAGVSALLLRRRSV